MFKYFKNSYNELVNKVTWPSFEQLMGSTKVVLVASVIFALVVLAMDLVFENLMNKLVIGFFYVIKHNSLNSYFSIWQEQRDSNSHQRFWRPLFYP